MHQFTGSFLLFVHRLVESFHQWRKSSVNTLNEQKVSLSAKGCSELLSWLQLKHALYLASENKITVLPVFSQPSSSLWSEQSSSPSHLHDNRTQRPVPQRNWSAVHMDVAKRTSQKQTSCFFYPFHRITDIFWVPAVFYHHKHEIR